MYTHETTTGEKLLFDDARREQFAGVSIYYQGNTGRFYVWSGARSIGHMSIYTYMYGPSGRGHESAYTHVNGDRFDFRDENVKKIGLGDHYRNSRPRDGRKYKGVYNLADGDRYTVVWLAGNKCVQLRNGNESDETRAALYNAVKDYLGLPGWRNPTSETVTLTPEQIEIIEARVAGKTVKRAPKNKE